MNAPSVAIVILNWNGRSYLEKFLPSITATVYSNLSIVVADNASTDDSVDFLRRTYPNVQLVLLKRNHGFAGGYNEALRQVKSDYYVLLNSDVEVKPDWLEPIIQLLEKEPGYGACQPKILSWHNKELFEYAGAAGGWIDLYGYPFSRGRVFEICEQDRGQFDRTEPIFWASGAAMVIRSEAFHAMEGFDDYLFAHQEEIDLCWRLQLSGYRICCCPQSVVYHVGGGTLPKGNSRKTFLNFRNNQILLAKNLHWSEKWWKIPYRLLLDQVSALKGLLGGDFGYFIAIFKAHIGFLDWAVFGKKKSFDGRRRRLRTMDGVFRGNVVWEHFARKKKFFGEIVKR
ncbi:MAG TPA: glycosyltransferase family 2 protein [Flavisolibacter sp.]|nr:glycosyltransferase family 2 protein [Flavisolibacter sp.]